MRIELNREEMIAMIEILKEFADSLPIKENEQFIEEMTPLFDDMPNEEVYVTEEVNIAPTLKLIVDGLGCIKGHLLDLNIDIDNLEKEELQELLKLAINGSIKEIQSVRRKPYNNLLDKVRDLFKLSKAIGRAIGNGVKLNNTKEAANELIRAIRRRERSSSNIEA